MGVSQLTGGEDGWTVFQEKGTAHAKARRRKIKVHSRVVMVTGDQSEKLESFTRPYKLG